MVSAQVRRTQAHYAIERGLSQQQACVLMQVSRSTLGDESKLRLKNAMVIESMRALDGVSPEVRADNPTRSHEFLEVSGPIKPVRSMMPGCMLSRFKHAIE